MNLLPIKSGVKPLLAVSVLCTIGVIFTAYAIVSIHNSEKCMIAKQYLENNPEFLDQVGSIINYGYFVSHHVSNSETKSYIGLKVQGTKKTVRVKVHFIKDPEGNWKIYSFSTVKGFII